MHEKKSKENKKGQVEISFNWIFILLAGGAILIFFIFVITKETDTSKEQINYEITQRMESLLSAVERNPSSIKDLGYMGVELTFTCQDGIHEYYIKGGNNRERLGTQLIFTPKIIGLDKVLAWTLDFDAPYPVSALLYMSDQKTMYVFDSMLPEYFTGEFPDQFSKQVLSINEMKEYKDQGLRKYVFVVRKDNLGVGKLNLINLQPALKEKLTVIVVPQHIGSGRHILSSGKIEFKDFSNGHLDNSDSVTIGSSAFVTEEMLYGAIISADPDIYECVVEKLLTRTRLADDLNIVRTTRISGEFLDYSICRTYYNKANQSIVIKKQKAANFETFNSSLDQFVEQYNNLVKINSELFKTSCPVMY